MKGKDMPSIDVERTQRFLSRSWSSCTLLFLVCQLASFLAAGLLVLERPHHTRGELNTPIASYTYNGQTKSNCS